ncbi:MAG: glycosyltransferase [Mycobacterium sp.]|nr:glycosyltransferase [Mycobacterium sp.]
MARFVVVTPVLNGATYISATLDSIRAQTDPDWIHYLVDGGSTDGTLDIIARAVAEDSRRRLLVGTDRGLYDAVFKGFERARADGVIRPDTICAWLGSDDLLMPWAVATLRERFDATGAEWMAAVPTIWDYEGRLALVLRPNWYPRQLIRAGLFNPRILGGIQQESTFFTASLLAKLPAETVATIRTARLAGDFLLWRAFARYADLVPITAAVAGFRKHGGNLSTTQVESYYQEIRDSGVRIPPAWLGRVLRRGYRLLASRATSRQLRRRGEEFEAAAALLTAPRAG